MNKCMTLVPDHTTYLIIGPAMCSLNAHINGFLELGNILKCRRESVYSSGCDSKISSHILYTSHNIKANCFKYNWQEMS